MKVELVEIDWVVPYARNPRRNEKEILKVAASIKEYGFRQSVVVDEELVIIAGHTGGALQAAQVKAYRLADNRTHEDSEWTKSWLLSQATRAYKPRR